MLGYFAIRPRTVQRLVELFQIPVQRTPEPVVTDDLAPPEIWTLETGTMPGEGLSRVDLVPRQNFYFKFCFHLMLKCIPLKVFLLTFLCGFLHKLH